MAQRQHQHNTLASIKQHLRNYEQKFLGGAKYISARRKLNDLTKLALGGGAKWKWLVGKKNKKKKQALQISGPMHTVHTKQINEQQMRKYRDRGALVRAGPHLAN